MNRQTIAWCARGAVTLTIIAVLLVILAWPQKIGDVRTNQRTHAPEVYWRGADPAVPGRWLPKADSQGPHKVVDSVPVGGHRRVNLLDDDTVWISEE